MSPYFDGCFFDPAYFDAAPCGPQPPKGGHPSNAARLAEDDELVALMIAMEGPS